MKRIHVYILAGMLLLVIIVWAAWPTKRTIAPTTNSSNTAALTNLPNEIDQPVNGTSDTIVFSTADLPDRDPAFSFTAVLPKTWRVEYVPSGLGINIYDPQVRGKSSLEQSTIFITHYTASSFKTLSAVDIVGQTDTTINGHEARTYTIQPKAGVMIFTGQPAWRLRPHRVTEIRSSDLDPAIFYIYAKSPLVTDQQFDTLLSSVTY